VLKWLRTNWFAAIMMALAFVYGSYPFVVLFEPSHAPSNYATQENAAHQPNDHQPWDLASIGAIAASVFTGLLAVFAFIQVRDARRSSERQLRAYLTLQSITVDPAFQLGVGGIPYVEGFVCWAVWHNAGQTPAYQANTIISWDQFPIIENREPNFTQRPVGQGIDVGPKMPVQTGYQLIPIAHLLGVWNRETEVFIRARVEYFDAMHPKELRHTEICMMLDLLRVPTEVPPQGAAKNLPNVTLKAYGPQNTST